MSRTAEEAMLYAAMTDDQEMLDRLARDTTPVERRDLTRALNRVYDALVNAHALEHTQSTDREVVRCDYCGDALPSVERREHVPTPPALQRLGFSADKVVCPGCVAKRQPTERESDHG